MPDKVVRVDVMILGDRHFPVASTKLPEAAVADLPLLLEGAQAKNPSLTYEEVVRAIWRLGTSRLRANLAAGLPLSIKDLPGLVRPVRKGAQGK